VTLRRAMLPDDPACPALADAETVAKHRDRPTPTDRAYQFPGMRMLASLVVSGAAPTVAGPGHGALIGIRERAGRA
jgi:hypothetical protein